ncbi:MAG: helicase HerA domain-containing protein [Anaerolineales bacterium]
MPPPLTHFYLGRALDPHTNQPTNQPLHYNPDDLTTHAVVVGMTGSGKTGLCIGLLEEAALAGIPALMIDPKGDITNTLLHFPDLAPQDFQPWVNAGQARREGKTVEQAAAETAERWKKGLAAWDIPPDRVRALANAAHFTVYTPGSTAGVPISILASLKAPGVPWDEHREILREKIAGTVTAILGLAGMDDVDPVRTREHILLANIFEHAWSQGADLDLGELIMQVQSPPFQKLGVFDINRFFPEKDRFELAMLLNNILAAPGFQTWLEGVPLDIPSLLYDSDGRPRHSVFYIAHLTDAERMFFVALLFSAVETWMRGQRGTTTLRTLLYFDEIFGYLPPGRNPPSKTHILRMLKQARAFGVGLVLVTQNPVDVDYKALSNAGAWFIGKLQTERDKERLLDGLQGAAPGIDRREINRLISQLGKRVFLLHNVHEAHPVLFKTRWTMNYLAGPVTRVQIPALSRLVKGEQTRAPDRVPASSRVVAPPGEQPPAGTGSPPLAAPPPERDLPGTVTRPKVPGRVREFFLPHNLTLSQAAKQDGRALPPDAIPQGIIYRPVLLAQADVRFLNRKYNLDHELRQTAIVVEPDPRGVVRWDDYTGEPLDPRSMDRGPVPESRFAALESPLSEAALMSRLRTDFVDWVYRTIEATVRANETLKVYAGPNVSQADFRKTCSEVARAKRDAEIKKAEHTLDRNIDRLREKLAREERELDDDKIELQQRKMEEMGTHAENILGLFGKSRRRTLSTSLQKRRMTGRAKADVEESIDEITRLTRQIEQAEKDKAGELAEINRRWTDVVDDLVEIPMHPYKKDIRVDMFGVAWFPHWLVEIGRKVLELPGFNP